MGIFVCSFQEYPIVLNDPNGDCPDCTDKGSVSTDSKDPIAALIGVKGKQGDRYKVSYNNRIVDIDGGQSKMKQDETYLTYHEGNDYYKAGWYSDEEYAYTQLDYEGGQVMPPQSTLSQAINPKSWGERTDENFFQDWEVGQDGYLTGEAAPMIIDPTIFF